MSYPGQYPNFTFQFDQCHQSFGNDSWTPTQSNSWEPNSNLDQSYQSWEPNSNYVVSNDFYQGDSNYFQSFTPYTSDYWDPNQTTSDYMGPNHFIPPLDSYQESWAQNENFDSNSLLPNQNGEWISQSYDPCNLEPSYSYPPPSEEPIDKLEQMMRGMEDSLFELQKHRAQVEMMCQACTPANDSPSEIGNPYPSNVIIPISSSDHKDDHIPDYSLNQNQKEYDFNFTYLDTSSRGEDILNSNLLSSCQFEPQHNHLEIKTQLKNHDAPHFNSSNQIHHDPYFVSPSDLQIESHINTYLTGRMLEDSEPELLLDHLNNEHNDLRKPEELAGVNIDNIPPLTQEQDKMMDQLIKQLSFSHLDNNFKFDMCDPTIHSSDIHPPSPCEHEDTIFDTNNTHDSHLDFPWSNQSDQENNIPIIQPKPNLTWGNTYCSLEPMSELHQTLISKPNSLWNHDFS